MTIGGFRNLGRRVLAGATVVKTHLGGWRTVRAASVILIPLALVPWIVDQVGKSLGSPLFRDGAQSQYSGWCIRQGMKLYRDVGAPDGPFIHFLHAIMQVFAGISDRGCRWADLVIQVGGSGTMGALLAPRFAETRLASILQRLSWALLGVAMWMCWYLPYGWQQTVQRDAYYALCGYLGLVLIHVSADFQPRAARAAAFIGGAACITMLFTRHSGIIIPAAAALGLLVSDEPSRELRAVRRKAALQGALAGFVVMMLAVTVFGSLRGMGFWYFRFPFTFHAWLARRSPLVLLTEEFESAGLVSVLALVGVLTAIVVGAAPRRSLAFAFPPMLFLIAACIVGKGWINHVQQVMAAVVPLQLLVLSALFNHRPEQKRWRPNHAVFAVAALLFVSYRAHQALMESQFRKLPMPVPVDHDIREARIVASFLKERTKPEDTVFYYGHESHVLLDAERRTATPYYVNMLLNVDRFYQGAPATPGQEPNKRQLAAIHRLQTDINADACPRLTSKPPGAMVFLDDSLGIFIHGVAEVTALCPEVGPLLQARYTRADLPGLPRYQVYLRNK